MYLTFLQVNTYQLQGDLILNWDKMCIDGFLILAMSFIGRSLTPLLIASGCECHALPTKCPNKESKVYIRWRSKIKSRREKINFTFSGYIYILYYIYCVLPDTRENYLRRQAPILSTHTYIYLGQHD